MRTTKYILSIPILIFLIACGQDGKPDAYGNFEATTVTLSAKGTGELISFSIQEGTIISMGEKVGLVDTTQLQLEKLQIEAQIKAVSRKILEAGPDIRVLEERKANVLREKKRTEALLKESAATQKQLDDYIGELELLSKQIASLKSNISVTNRGILAEIDPLKAQINVLNNRIKNHIIISPIEGTVLTKLVEESEFVNTGTPLFKIADLLELKLKAYTTAKLLQNVSLNDEVTVLIDNSEGGYKELTGRLSWIASEAEFTPENIQTKEDRVGLVYAIDVIVKNDGTLKIGMPGEVVFNKQGQ